MFYGFMSSYLLCLGVLYVLSGLIFFHQGLVQGTDLFDLHFVLFFGFGVPVGQQLRTRDLTYICLNNS